MTLLFYILIAVACFSVVFALASIFSEEPTMFFLFGVIAAFCIFASINIYDGAEKNALSKEIQKQYGTIDSIDKDSIGIDGDNFKLINGNPKIDGSEDVEFIDPSDYKYGQVVVYEYVNSEFSRYLVSIDEVELEE